jgi:hypothetical protein
MFKILLGFTVFLTVCGFLVIRLLLILPTDMVKSNIAECAPGYKTIDPHHETKHDDPSDIPVRHKTSIAMVTMHDTRQILMPPELADMTGISPGKSIDILEAVYKNRRDYADMHGYTLIDGTKFRGTEPKPAWYKIKVRSPQ